MTMQHTDWDRRLQSGSAKRDLEPLQQRSHFCFFFCFRSSAGSLRAWQEVSKVFCNPCKHALKALTPLWQMPHCAARAPSAVAPPAASRDNAVQTGAELELLSF